MSVDRGGNCSGETLAALAPHAGRGPLGLAFEAGADGVDLSVNSTGISVRVVEQPGDHRAYDGRESPFVFRPLGRFVVSSFRNKSTMRFRGRKTIGQNAYKFEVRGRTSA